ncbi:MAG: methyltransferase domain-containing protein [Rickettsiales bacterium]|nr:methyltransferase domain-containing protein [Rickettsiales bacterium]
MANCLKCPVCNLNLTKNKQNYICSNNHNFDISKDGYANLLLCNQKRSKDPGDSKEMIKSRNEFLQKGFYNAISDSLNKFIFNQLQDDVNNICETGCGTGYYLINLRKFLIEQNFNKINYYGLDISRHAITIASKSNKNIKWIVANSYNIPLLNNSQDIILNIFSPYKIEELIGILKPKGKVYFVVPGKNHLNTFREIIYGNKEQEKNIDKLRDNIEKSKILKITNSVEIEEELNVKNNEDIMNLLYMTPYYWNMDLEKLKIFKNLNEILIKLNIIILEVEKI